MIHLQVQTPVGNLNLSIVYCFVQDTVHVCHPSVSGLVVTGSEREAYFQLYRDRTLTPEARSWYNVVSHSTSSSHRCLQLCGQHNGCHIAACHAEDKLCDISTKLDLVYEATATTTANWVLYVQSLGKYKYAL